MEHHFLAFVVTCWFGHLPPGCLLTVPVWVGSRLVLCFKDSRLFLCPLKLDDCSSYEAHSRNYTVDFLPDWQVGLH